MPNGSWSALGRAQLPTIQGRFLDVRNTVRTRQSLRYQSELQLFYCDGLGASEELQSSIANCTAFNGLRWDTASPMPQALRGAACATVGGVGFTCGGENQARSMTEAILFT